VISVRPRGPGPLAPLPRAATVVSTGALGFLDAAEEDRRRLVLGFRSLLDGLDAPLQVLIEYTPGRGGLEITDEAADMVLPTDRAARRAADLGFARQLRHTRPAQRRDVYCATGGSPDALVSALNLLGIPDVRAIEWTPPAGLAVGRELPASLRDGCGWHRTWFVDRFPGTELEAGWLRRLAPPGLHLSLSWHAQKLPTPWVVDYLQRQLVNMRASLLHQGHDKDPQIQGAIPAARALQQRLTAGQESAFHVALYLTATAESRTALEEAARLVEGAGRAALCSLLSCRFRQLDGRLATAPLGRDPLQRWRVMDTSSLATLFPWFDGDLQEESGLVVGRSRSTGQPVMVDPFDDRRYANANIGVFGHSGAGKTYLLSTLAMGAMSAGTQVFVIDPEHEYGALARQLGGLEVNIALGSGHAINVLDVEGRARDETVLGPIAADVVELCGAICGGIEEAERARLEETIRDTFACLDAPLLADVADRLPPGSRLGRILARWVRGSLGQIFSRPTNIDLQAPLVAFGMRELRAEMVAPVHYLLAEALWARIKKRDRRRLLVIDELGLLFEDATIRRFVVTLARRIRKYHGSLVFATQNPGDLLSSEPGAVVAMNPALHFFGAQRPADAARLQKAFHLSEAQRNGLESARRGDFLLAAGSDRLPVRVCAPAWQAAAMRRGRDPPTLQFQPHVRAGGAVEAWGRRSQPAVEGRGELG
jgi:conjugal transfer ATP-binding protein TraC